jgi:hypothetical protein
MGEVVKFPVRTIFVGQSDGVRIDVVRGQPDAGKARELRAFQKMFECLGTNRVDECYCPCCDGMRKARQFPYKGE